MQLNQIQCFVAVAEEGSFTRAAERLYLAQPNVSQHIRRLEAELGVTLFVRGRHGARLTDAGRAFLERARSALGELDDARSVMDEYAGLLRGRVSVGVGVYSIVEEVVEMVARFRELHPGVTVAIEDALMPEEACANVEHEELDLAVISEDIEAPGVDRTAFATKAVRLIVPHGHPLCERAKVPVAELADEDFVFWPTHPEHETFTAACVAEGFEPRRAFTSRQLTTIRALVVEGLGIAAVSTAVAHLFEPAATVVELGPPNVQRHYFLCWPSHGAHSHAGAALVEHARAFVAARTE